MVSSPDETTIKTCSKKYSRSYNQTIIGTILSCHNFYPKNNKAPQGNREMFPQDMNVTHRGFNQYSYIKSINTTMVHLHKKLQGVKLTRNTTTGTDLEENCKTNVVFYATMEPSTTQEGKFYSKLCWRFLITSSKGNK